MTQNLLIRADGSAAIGTGHVMRCLALAQAWQRHGRKAVFLQAKTTPALAERLQAEGMETQQLNAAPGSAEDAAQSLALARSLKAEWVVGDGYALDATWQRQLRDGGQHLLVVDDYGHASDYAADFLLNQNLGADPGLYAQRGPATRLLLGPRYALLRREFLHPLRPERQFSKSANRVLVTLGGSDPDNVTGKVLEALARLDGLQIVAVAGGSNPNLEKLRTTVAGVHQARLVVNASNMPELMAWADLAIAAGGSTCWELARMRLPAILLVLAPNQATVADALDRHGIGLNLGECGQVSSAAVAAAVRALLSDASVREGMSARTRYLVDGHGGARVATRLLAAGISLRRARAEDCRQLWDWANDPAVRRASFSTNPIPWADHVRWFERKLKDARSAMFMATAPDSRLVGQVRLEWPENDRAFVDVSIAPECRGTGLGSAMLRRVADEAFATLPLRELHAYIKPENHASIGAFTRADFDIAVPAVVQEHEVVHFQATKAE